MKKILIIENDLSYLDLLREHLKTHGYSVNSQNDGTAGLKTAIHEKPDLILLAIKLPQMDGLTMLSELRKDAYGKSAKVIILTSLEPDTEILQKVVATEPIYYLIKEDTTMADLCEKINELLY